MRKIEKQKEHWTKRNEEGKHHLDQLSQILGMKVGVGKCSTIWNNVMAERIHNRASIPELVENEALMSFVKESADFSVRDSLPTVQSDLQMPAPE